MSQLQIGLITLGALIILAVLLFNWWQERAIKREMFRRFDGPLDDVLMDESRAKTTVEPVEEFHIDPEAILEPRTVEMPIDEPLPQEPEATAELPEAMPADEPDVVVEPEPEPVLEAEPPALREETLSEESAPEPIRLSDPEPEIAPPSELPVSVDAQIDEIAIITLNQPCAGAAIRDALQPLPAFQKPVRWLGEDASGKVMLLTKEQEQAQFSRVIAALQLADRSGPVNGEDLRNFHAKVEDLESRIGGALEWREHGDPLQYARELDQFCIDVDVMIGLQLLAGGSPFAGTKLRGIAEANGGVLKEDGQFHFGNESGDSLFVLASLDRKPMNSEMLRTAMLRGVTLLMDIPRVSNGAEVFNQMVLVGRKLETALASKLMDENQRPLGDPEIDKIRQQLKILYSKMFARGVTPGSASALRLFS